MYHNHFMYNCLFFMYIKKIMTPKKDLFIENITLFKTFEITAKEQLENEIFNVFSQIEKAKNKRRLRSYQLFM